MTKRRKLAIKAQKLVELMMVSGVPTSSGFEERIRFSELEIVDRDAIDTGLIASQPQGNYLNGWDVNVAGVRITSVKRNIRYHKHAVCVPCCAAFGAVLTCSRNSSSVSREKGSSNTSLADATVTSVVCIRGCELSCRAKSSRRCRERIRPARQHRTL